jgi:hypothetical protein
LRRTKWAGIETVTATYAQIFVMENHTIFGGVETVNRTDRLARCIGTVHTRHGNRFFTRYTIINRHHATTVYAPRDFVFVLTGDYASVTLDTALGITQKLHSSHCFANLF